MNILANNEWYKDAIIYQLHVRAFCDSSGDGIGDFTGLTSKLDYLKELGVNALWLLPFYPSPLRDDGYDIADYRGIHPDYGKLSDFRLFLREAHKREIRVITELVINHTSDQHPWFQAARSAPVGSAKRDYYVWSKTVKRYEDARIIFSDFEKSNWAWDDTAKAYYWHRFFSHQPDLNFDNPHVIKAVLRAMRFWLDMGVDGLRLDAIPYLIQREGTNCENLPETHTVIKKMRAELDRHYSDRIFLAEANQWPEDVREYFGEGDECHMAFHFPLMPRIFMAIAQEERHPISEILAQTPEIPENCQWAIFLRNHDELTLEMVTDRERDYMYDIYATDPRTRVNLGIRRRLAPLMDNDRAKIELLNSLMLAMPGSPIIYYGDEIGMGDNIYLGDRNGVRTPMQWSPDRNAGFSSADPQRLYLPLIMDAVYGYEAVNVEAQGRHASSLLNWMRRLISTRKSHKAFGRGTIVFLHPGNRKILAYVYTYQNEKILCVFNLSHSAQPVELDLAAYKGLVPVELLDNSIFPAIGELPYLLSLQRYGFYWFSLSAEVEPPIWHVDKLPREEIPVLVLPENPFAALVGKSTGKVHDVLARKTFEHLKGEVLPAYFYGQRWFTGMANRITNIELEVTSEWSGLGDKKWLPLIVKVSFETVPKQCYFLPLGLMFDVVEEQEYKSLSPWMLARVRRHAKVGMIYDALGEDDFCHYLLNAMKNSEQIAFGTGEMIFTKTAEFPDISSSLAVDRPGLKQSNTSVMFGEQLILKVYRRVQEGINPELEMGYFLNDLSPSLNIVPLVGTIEYHAAGTVTAIAVMHRYISNQGSLWDYTQDYLDRLLTLCVDEADSVHDPETHAVYIAQMLKLGQRTAELHCALASSSGNLAFDPEPLTREDIIAHVANLKTGLVSSLARLEKSMMQQPADLRDKAANLVAANLQVFNRLAVSTDIPLYKLRVHGNYNLDQILIVDNDFVLTDFEGDPNRSLDERRAKYSPLKDLASMYYSLSEAAMTALHVHKAARAEQHGTLEPCIKQWLQTARDAFMKGYFAAIDDRSLYLAETNQTQTLFDIYLMDKALEGLDAALTTQPVRLEVAMQILFESLADEGQLKGVIDRAP